MRNIIILDGNNELGVELTRQWLARDPRAEFYVVSRYGVPVVKNPRVIAISADPTDLQAVESRLPDRPFMAIIDLASSPHTPRHNDQAARCALALAGSRNIPVIGYAAGRMGPAPYRVTERDIVHHLQSSSVHTAMVRPPYIYSEHSRGGANRRLATRYTAVSVVSHITPHIEALDPLSVGDAADQLIDAVVREVTAAQVKN